MKMNINKLQAAAKRIHSRARKFTKRQIAAMTAVTIGLAAVTVGSFSQVAQNEEIPPLPITPTGNVQIYNKKGVRVVARLNSRTRDTISFQKFNLDLRKVEDKVFTINIDTLDQLSQDVINGKVTNGNAVRQRQEKEAEKYREAIRALDEKLKAKEEKNRKMLIESSNRRLELNEKYKYLSAKDQQKALIENSRDMQVYLYLCKDRTLIHEHIGKNMGKLESTNVTHSFTWDYGKTLVIPDQTKDETFSLRPEFERLGVVATNQISRVGAIHASFNLAQFITRKHKIRPPSIEEWRKCAIDQFTHEGKVVESIAKYNIFNGILAWVGNKNVHVTWTNIPLANLRNEATKKLLREGTPVFVEWDTKITDEYNKAIIMHASVIVGFRVKSGVTEWEIIDSIQVEQNRGYKFIPAEKAYPTFGIEIK